MFANHTSCGTPNELEVLNRSRKRVREVKHNSEPVNFGASAWDALNLINQFNEISLLEENDERINDKDTLCQDFIDRFEKLYKPAAIGEDKTFTKRPIQPCNKDSEKYSLKLKLKYHHDDYTSTTKDDCSMKFLNFKFGDELEGRQILGDYNFPDNFGKVLLKHDLKDRRPPYGWYADILMGRAVINADLLGNTARKMLVYGADNLNNDFYATNVWTRTSQPISVKAIMCGESDNDSDSSNKQMTIAAKQRKRRKISSYLVK